MENVANSSLLRTVLIFHSLSSILAVPVLVLFLRWIFMRPLMHFNTKFILIFNIICALSHLLARIYQYVSKLFEIFRERSDGCQIIPDPQYCFYVRLWYNCGLWPCYITTIIIALERLIATIFLRRYYCNRTVGPLLIVAQIVFTSILLLIMYIPTKTSDVIIYYCIAMSPERPLYTITSISIAMITQSIAIILFIKLQRLNKKLRWKLSASGDLGGRYQVEETPRSLKTISPFLYVSYTFIFTILTLICIVVTIGHKLSTPLFLALIEGSNWYPQFCLFLPILLWHRSRSISNQVKIALTTEIATGIERYQEDLKKMWG